MKFILDIPGSVIKSKKGHVVTKITTADFYF